MTYEDFVEYISNLDPDYSIGVHGVSGEGNYLEKIPSIMSQGLKTKGWGGILSNVAMFGKVRDLTEKDYRDIYNYVYSADVNKNIVNFIFAFPETYTTEEGREFFLGSFPRVDGYAKGHGTAGDHNPLNVIAEFKKVIPKEFILGYNIMKMDTEDFEFHQNPGFFPYVEGFDKEFEKLLDEHHIIDMEKATAKIEFLKNLPETFRNEYYDSLIAFIEARLAQKKDL